MFPAQLQERMLERQREEKEKYAAMDENSAARKVRACVRACVCACVCVRVCVCMYVCVCVSE